jgi:hypothetical protein
MALDLGQKVNYPIQLNSIFIGRKKVKRNLLN